jgi:hypothetical protein
MDRTTHSVVSHGLTLVDETLFNLLCFERDLPAGMSSALRAAAKEVRLASKLLGEMQ